MRDNLKSITKTDKLVISQGGTTIVPNLIDLTKEKAATSCSKAKIKCKFIYVENADKFQKLRALLEHL